MHELTPVYRATTTISQTLRAGDDMGVALCNVNVSTLVPSYLGGGALPPHRLDARSVSLAVCA